jgi:hypothetical protein
MVLVKKTECSFHEFFGGRHAWYGKCMTTLQVTVYT